MGEFISIKRIESLLYIVMGVPTAAGGVGADVAQANCHQQRWLTRLCGSCCAPDGTFIGEEIRIL